MVTESPVTGGRGRSRSLAALLSFLWPGLGQFYLGKRRTAALFAVPALLVLLLVAYGLQRGAVVLAAQLFADRTIGLVAVAILVLLGVWRLASVILAFVGGQEPRPTRNRIVDRAVVIALVLIIAITHFGGSYYLLAYSNAGSQVFDPNNPDLIVQSSGSSLAPGETAQPNDTLPPPSSGGRVTILFTGVDSAPGRGETLYDSILVVSYDPASQSVQMISVPRDSASFPFYFGGVDSPTVKINALPTYVRHGWIKSPNSPYVTLVNEVSYLVGIPINYYAVMDLLGFVKMIDAVGGIDIVNPGAISDPTYDWLNGGNLGFYLTAGSHHLNGKNALAYVRSRHGSNGTTGNSDYARADRQQQVLIALLHKMAQPSQILALPGLISTIGSSVSTDFPSDKVADYVAIGQNVQSGSIKQVVLEPPTYSVTGISTVTASSCLINAKVAALSVQWFGKDSTWYGKPAPANTCP